jgi:hypothetical protein
LRFRGDRFESALDGLRAPRPTPRNGPLGEPVEPINLKTVQDKVTVTAVMSHREWLAADAARLQLQQHSAKSKHPAKLPL